MVVVRGPTSAIRSSLHVHDSTLPIVSKVHCYLIAAVTAVTASALTATTITVHQYSNLSTEVVYIVVLKYLSTEIAKQVAQVLKFEY